MSTDEKAQVLETVEASRGSKRKVMVELGVPKSRYYGRILCGIARQPPPSLTRVMWLANLSPHTIYAR